MGRYRFALFGGLLGAGYMSVLYWIAQADSISPVGDTGGVALGLIQLVALFAPALALFMQALLRYSADKAKMSGSSGGVGPLSPEVFRVTVLFAGFLSSVLTINGLIILLITLDLPAAIELAAIPIGLGMLIVPFLLGLIVWYEYWDL